jgi:pantoate--beta-alanine ligase
LQVWKTPAEALAGVDAHRRAGRRVGLVPTMGNLHAGHRSLLERARAECAAVVATLFVNPLQFDNPEDLAKYPRTEAEDLEMCRQAGVDAVFMPSVAAMYPPNSTTIVEVRGVQDPLCGRSRPGHFAGVATVVAKLFHIAPADVAYFGLKDYQQSLLIRRMVRDLNFPIAVRLCPTVREPDGLAMSSRNSRLTPAHRAQAVVISRMLRLAEARFVAGERAVEPLKTRMRALLADAPAAELDYLEFAHADTLEAVERLDGPTVVAAACRFGGVRLIDNVLLGLSGED